MFSLKKDELGDIILLDEPIYKKTTNEDLCIKKFELEKLNSVDPILVDTFYMIPEINSNSYISYFEIERKQKIDMLVYFDYVSETEELYLLLDFFLKDNYNDEPFKSYDKKIDVSIYFNQLIKKIENDIIIDYFSVDIIQDIIEKIKVDFFIDNFKNKCLTTPTIELNTDIEIKVNYKDSKKIYGICNRCMINFKESKLLLGEVILNNKITINKDSDENLHFEIKIKIDDNLSFVIEGLNLDTIIGENIKYIYFSLNWCCFNLGENNNFISLKNNNLNYKKFDLHENSPLEQMKNLLKYLNNNNTNEELRNFYKENKIRTTKKININNYLLYI